MEIVSQENMKVVAIGKKDKREITRFIEYGAVEELRSLISKLVEKKQWRKTESVVFDALEDFYESNWFEMHACFFRIFDMQELLGYDGEIRQISNSIKNLNTFDEVKAALHQKLVLSIGQQIEKNGSLLLFDTERMLATSAAVLVKQLLEKRVITRGKVNYFNNGLPRSIVSIEDVIDATPDLLSKTQAEFGSLSKDRPSDMIEFMRHIREGV